MTHVLDLDGILPAVITASRSRAVAGGVDPNQYDAVTSTLRTAREWPAAFIATANEHLTRADTAASASNTVTAAEAYLSAAAWFHFATIVPHPDRTGHQHAADAMAQALTHLDPTARHLNGARFAGILRTPPNRAFGPLVVIVSGLDSSKEEFHPVAEALLRRGIATLAIDGPGQGQLAPTTAPVPDYHHVVSDALDALADAGIWKPTAIGVIALSLGGFYGALSLAHEPRLQAGVTVSGPYTLAWEQLPPFVTDTVILRTGGPLPPNNSPTRSTSPTSLHTSTSHCSSSTAATTSFRERSTANPWHSKHLTANTSSCQKVTISSATPAGNGCPAPPTGSPNISTPEPRARGRRLFYRRYLA